MRFDTQEIKRRVKENFNEAWQEGASYVSRPPAGGVMLEGTGSPHPVAEVIQKLRQAYIGMGFKESYNPVIIDEVEIFRQFNQEALAVLDRVYYLAGLPRPNVGISVDRIAACDEALGRQLQYDEVKALQDTFQAYKKGKVEGDDLVAVLSHRLDSPEGKIVMMLDRVFPEFRDLEPVPTRRTLRSHMTSGWFLTLEALVPRREPPISLFSIGMVFRREQEENVDRLRSYHSASCVIAEPDVNVAHGEAVARGLLTPLGFTDIKFRPDDKRSKYYTPGTQTEVFGFHPGLVGGKGKYKDGWVEVATFGIYSPTALAQYDIPYPVMNLGLGVERLAMLVSGEKDIRELVYPQFRVDWEMSDSEIAAGIEYDQAPDTTEGKAVADAIVRTCNEKGDTPSPCELLAYRGLLGGRKVEVWVVEPESDTKLCGPAAKNEIIVYDGNILGLPRISKWDKQFNDGVVTGLTFAGAVAAAASAAFERGEDEMRFKGVRTAPEINIFVKPMAVRYIQGRNKKIDLRGPVFTTVKMKEA